MVEHQLPKLRVAGPNPVSRSQEEVFGLLLSFPDAPVRQRIGVDEASSIRRPAEPAPGNFAEHMPAKGKTASSGSTELRVVELFAGVGGFRIGLQAANKRRTGPAYRVVWSNQWEPSTRTQDASKIYEARFGGEGHSNEDIGTVNATDIPDHDLLVGGFPCQDYSVASTLKASKGIQGKKGVLWWEIHRILREKALSPKYLLLENVDRLLGSPAKQRGRDMAILLRSLCNLGYAVEWRVVNAADYGMPQRRKRIFILGCHNTSPLFGRFQTMLTNEAGLQGGILQEAFPVVAGSREEKRFELNERIDRISAAFNAVGGKSPFKECGVMVNGKVLTARVDPRYTGTRATLGELLKPDHEIPGEFFIPRSQVPKWRALKNAKSEERISRSTGFKYSYSEGSMAFPDHLDRPARTIVTGEGGSGPSRFKHVVLTSEGKYRRLVPEELELINMFPPGHTEGASPSRRAFFMGNALVTGVVERIARKLSAAVARA